MGVVAWGPPCHRGLRLGKVGCAGHWCPAGLAHISCGSPGLLWPELLAGLLQHRHRERPLRHDGCHLLQGHQDLPGGECCPPGDVWGPCGHAQ